MANAADAVASPGSNHTFRFPLIVVATGWFLLGAGALLLGYAFVGSGVGGVGTVPVAAPLALVGYIVVTRRVDIGSDTIRCRRIVWSLRGFGRTAARSWDEVRGVRRVVFRRGAPLALLVFDDGWLILPPSLVASGGVTLADAVVEKWRLRRPAASDQPVFGGRAAIWRRWNTLRTVAIDISAEAVTVGPWGTGRQPIRLERERVRSLRVGNAVSTTNLTVEAEDGQELFVLIDDPRAIRGELERLDYEVLLGVSWEHSPPTG